MQSYCDSITLPLFAPINGTYRIIRIDRPARIVNAQREANLQISFKNIYSESETMTFQVLKPDGEPLTDIDGNDCFRIKIIPFQDVTENLF